MEDLIAQSIAPRRLNLWLLGIFAAIALVLTTEGIFGVMSYMVAQRTSEIGVRMALGATRADVLLMVARQGCGMTIAGIAAGIVAGIALTRYLESLLYAVKPRDPLVFTTVSIGLLGAALAASIIPACRASYIDPLVALRHE
jgi:putative ABC transport system permease protein